MDLERTVGLRPDGSVWLPDRHTAVGSILLKLAAMGVEIPAEAAGDEAVFHLAGNLFARYREQARLLAEHLCPADRRIQGYIDELQGTAGVRLPAETLILDQYGLARELSLPLDSDRDKNKLVSSYRLDNGVLHNGGPTCRPNDAPLDVGGCTGHSGCIHPGTHFIRLRKKDPGLRTSRRPATPSATARRK